MSTYDFLLGDLLTIYVVSFAQRCIHPLNFSFSETAF